MSVLITFKPKAKGSAPAASKMKLPVPMKPLKALAKPAGPPAPAVEVLPPDPLLQEFKIIENLTEPEALQMAKESLEACGWDEFRLGGVLSVIQKSEWFAGHASFRTYVDAELQLDYWKATRLVRIYDTLIDLDLPYGKFGHLQWTKMRELIRVLTKDNADAWIAVAEESTWSELHSQVQAELGKGDGASQQAVTNMTYKAHADQKETIQAAVEKMKESADTAVATVALEMICLEYLSGPGKKKAPHPTADPLSAASTAMQKIGPEESIRVFREVFPDWDVEATQPT